jgi:hypothetical protein
MKPYREIASLSCLQVICFLLLTHLEPDFFLLQFYQTVIYLAILIMLFFAEDRWAYMIGMVAPVTHDLRQRTARRGRSSASAAYPRACTNEHCQFPRRDFGTSQPAHDRRLRPALDEGIFWLGQIL